MGELPDAELAEMRRWFGPRVAGRDVLRLLDERDALAEEVATCHRLIAHLADFIFVEGYDPSALLAAWPDEARVLGTVRAGGDEEKAT